MRLGGTNSVAILYFLNITHMFVCLYLYSAFNKFTWKSQGIPNTTLEFYFKVILCGKLSQMRESISYLKVVSL
jgi:hypothetical protein